MDEILVAFVEDGQDHLDAMESGLLQLEAGDPGPDTLNAIFRAAHTIKGDAGVVSLDHVQHFAHMLEDYFDQLRKGTLAITPPLMTLLLKSCDHIKRMFAELLEGRFDPQPELEAAGARLREELEALLTGKPIPVRESPPLQAVLSPKAERVSGPTLLSDCWHIAVQFGPDMFRHGMDPRDFLVYLRSKGDIVAIETLTDGIPSTEAMDPDSCYLGFDIHLRSDATLADIEQVFDLVRDTVKLHIDPPSNTLQRFAKTIEDLTEGIRQESATAEKLPDIRIETREALKAGELQRVEAAGEPSPGKKKPKAAEARAIRVQADKLDQLIDLVGEIVVSSAGARHLAKQSKRKDLVVANTALVRQVEHMRELSLQLRMIEVGETFTRFKRVVRDMAQDLHREIELVINGADTELDKSVVEKIGDPLMHLVRNAIDHGIEPVDLRLAQGKPAVGRVELNAYHEAGGIVIEVVDDGKGLDKQRIRQKAIERGLVAEDQVLSDAEICDLIFLPGFSTAEKVTNISGRGVGMDVVRSNITALRGTVEVQTERGQGSRFIIRLPLTLAIIDGFLVGVGKASYVVPLEMVMECSRYRESGGSRDYINLRGEVLPTVNMREFFNVGGKHPARENVVVVQSGKLRAGILVDRLLGELQIVIKPLATMFQNIRGISGSTILASGEVALILDVPALVRMARETEEYTITSRKAIPRPPLEG